MTSFRDKLWPISQIKAPNCFSSLFYHSDRRTEVGTKNEMLL